MSTPTEITAPKPFVPEERAGAARTTAGGSAAAKISVRDLNFFYGRSQALHNIWLDIPERMVMAFIGPSGCASQLSCARSTA